VCTANVYDQLDYRNVCTMGYHKTLQSRSLSSHASGMLCSLERAASALLQGMKHGLISESQKKRNIHDVAMPTISPSKEIERNAASKKDQGGSVFVQQIRCTCGFP